MPTYVLRWKNTCFRAANSNDVESSETQICITAVCKPNFRLEDLALPYIRLTFCITVPVLMLMALAALVIVGMVVVAAGGSCRADDNVLMQMNQDRRGRRGRPGRRTSMNPLTKHGAVGVTG